MTKKNVVQEAQLIRYTYERLAEIGTWLEAGTTPLLSARVAVTKPVGTGTLRVVLVESDTLDGAGYPQSQLIIKGANVVDIFQQEATQVKTAR